MASEDDDTATCPTCKAAIPFARVERLLAHLQFGEGELDERVLALPTPAFARTALELDALGWITTKED